MRAPHLPRVGERREAIRLVRRTTPRDAAHRFNARHAARPQTLREIDPTRRSLVLAWMAFTITFGGLRLLTWLIHIEVGPFGDISTGGIHIHHYVWGILVLIAVGGLGIMGPEGRWHSATGLLYGIGMALVLDEAALLVSFEDVYWDSAGWTSVALALMLIGTAGAVLAATRSEEAEQGEQLRSGGRRDGEGRHEPPASPPRPH